MTEAEWSACEDSELMIEYLRGKTSDRKFRLFACACCRHIWKSMADIRCRRAVETAELYADGEATPAELEAVKTNADAARIEDENESYRTEFDPPEAKDKSRYGVCHAICAACKVSARTLIFVSRDRPFPDSCWGDCVQSARRAILASVPPHIASFRWTLLPAVGVAEHSEMEHQACLLRCIFGNPFRPVAVDPSWLRWNSGTVVALAQAAYDERAMPSGELDKDRLGILADALEDAGCHNADILNHLRSPGPHVRGCWVVDLLLAKE